MQKGYAIDIKLLEWEMEIGRETIFRTVRSHYNGSFGERHAVTVFDKLSEVLRNKETQQESEQQHPAS